MEDKLIDLAKDFGVPVVCVLAMLYFFVAKYMPAQHTRDTEKDTNFMKSINELTIRSDLQAKNFVDAQKVLMDSYMADQDQNRKADADIRAHHKEVIESISQQTKESIAQNSRWLESTTTNHIELRSELKLELKDLKRVMTEGLDRLNLLLTPSPLQVPTASIQIGGNP